MSEIVHLRALEEELTGGLDESAATAAIAEYPEVKTLELLLASTKERITQVEVLTHARDSYKRGLEMSEAAREADASSYEAKIAALQHRVAKLSTDLSFYQSAFDRQRESMEAADRIITRGLANAREDSRNRPKPEQPTDAATFVRNAAADGSYVDDGAPPPTFLTGGPSRSNVQPIQRRRDITRLAAPGMQS